MPTANSIGNSHLLVRGARVAWRRGRHLSPLPTQRWSSAQPAQPCVCTDRSREEKVMTFGDLLSMAPDLRTDNRCFKLCITFPLLESVHLNLRNPQAKVGKTHFCALRKQKLSQFSPRSVPAPDSSLINWETHSKKSSFLIFLKSLFIYS